MIEDQGIKDWFFKNKDLGNNNISRILNVEYAHSKLDNGDDLYITKYGLPFIEQLQPESFWTDKKWLNENSIRLSGTSSVCKVRTKPAGGKSIDLVVKWNRMGQDIPGAEEDEDMVDAEFNSPFEEFSLVMNLKHDVMTSPKPLDEVFIQIPLAIYVPAGSVELWRVGRREYKMREKVENHKEVELDMNRSYAVIYEWIPGLDAAQACSKGFLDEEFMQRLTLDADDTIEEKGYLVRDRKPHHLILTPTDDGDFPRTSDNKVKYGLIDFELLERTEKKKRALKKAKRSDYHKRQKDRFTIDIPKKFHPHLSHANIFGVEYVFGRVESTKGRLWVVGKDPYLFDYFLPERWKNINKTKISMFSESYYTVSKDDIHLVWEVSKVGFVPDMDPFKEDEKRVLEHGFNSPFEEIALAVELSNKGISTIYPRAIYMTGDATAVPTEYFDDSRYKSHKEFVAGDGEEILKPNHYYITIWGYWNGPDEKIAAKDGDFYEGVNALTAYREGIIAQEDYINLLETTKQKLFKVGVEDLNLRGGHLLISFDSDGEMITDASGDPEVRICNFEFLKKL